MYEDEAKDLLQSILIQLNLLEENYSEDTIKKFDGYSETINK